MKDFLSLEDFAKQYKPFLITEYSPKNKYKMAYYPYNDQHRVIWKCHKCGFEYKEMISNRTHPRYPTSCPICSGSMQDDGTIRADIAFRCKETIDRQWSVYNEIDPTEEKIYSHKIAEWYCPLCHMTHDVSILKKMQGFGKTCRECSQKECRVTSFMWQAIYY